MNVFEENNLCNRVWGPAAAEMGWRMEEYVTATGRRMALSRFTLHSLRDRYANTAIHEWGYTEEQLLQQGSWQDAETVRRFYSGTTDDTTLPCDGCTGSSESVNFRVRDRCRRP